MTLEMTAALDRLLDDIRASYNTWQGTTPGDPYGVTAKMKWEFAEGLSFEEGRVYIKILSGRGVWGFVNKSNPKFLPGDILKAASWRSPALNQARGNILTGGYQVDWTGPHYLR